jgi:hypothetical protein
LAIVGVQKGSRCVYLAPILGSVVAPVAGAWSVSAYLHHTSCLIMYVGLRSVRRGDGWYVYSFQDITRSNNVLHIVRLWFWSTSIGLGTLGLLYLHKS